MDDRTTCCWHWGPRLGRVLGSLNDFKQNNISERLERRTLLVVQWLRVHLAVHKTLVEEIRSHVPQNSSACAVPLLMPACSGAHCSTTTEACMLRSPCSTTTEACMLRSPCSTTTDACMLWSPLPQLRPKTAKQRLTRAYQKVTGGYRRQHERILATQTWENLSSKWKNRVMTIRGYNTMNCLWKIIIIIHAP